MMKKRRVAITGLGVVSPLGLNLDSTWQNLIAGQSGADQIKHFDATKFPTTIAAEVKAFSLPDRFKKNKCNRFAMHFTEYALLAAEEALLDADYRPTPANARDWGSWWEAG